MYRSISINRQKEGDIMQKTAKYKQIEDYIKQEISRKNLQIGDQIMTEEQLCQRFNFSRMTINKALNHLSTLGYIERIPGRGSFVTAPRIQKENLGTGSSFTEDMKSIGLKAGARLLSYELLRADDIPTIAKKLELGGNDFIHYFVRLRTGNEKPIAISYTYVSAKIIPAINVDCLNASFYEFVDSLGLERELKQLELKATLPTDRQKELLAANNIALLCSSHITYTHIDGFLQPYEYIETYYNGDIYTYTYNVTK